MSLPFTPFDDFLQCTLNAQSPVTSITQLKSGTLRGIGCGAVMLEPKHRSDNDAARGLILSAGVHGNETAPIELLNLLVQDVLNESVEINRPTLILLGHPQAMKEQSRFVAFNMNRLFRGTHNTEPYRGSVDAERAAELEAFIDSFASHYKPSLHLDLHTAIRDSKIERFALQPFVNGGENGSLSPEAGDLLRAIGIEALVFQHREASTFSSHTACLYGSTSYTLELGKVRPFGQNDLAKYDNVLQTLKALVQDTPLPEGNDLLIQFDVCHEILIPDESFALHVDDDLANFTAFPKGYCMWSSDKDQYCVQAREERLIFPNANVPIGQRAGLMIVER